MHKSMKISERIWQDSIADLLVEARLADWRVDANSQVKKVVIHSGEEHHLVWLLTYIHHHAFIWWRTPPNSCSKHRYEHEIHTRALLPLHS